MRFSSCHSQECRGHYRTCKIKHFHMDTQRYETREERQQQRRDPPPGATTTSLHHEPTPGTRRRR